MARVAVLGGTGHIGGYLVPRLVEAGHDVTVLTRTGRTGPGWRPINPAGHLNLDVFVMLAASPSRWGRASTSCRRPRSPSVATPRRSPAHWNCPRGAERGQVPSLSDV